MSRLRSPLARYGLAVAATALASLLRFLSGPPDLDSDLTYFGFSMAVLAAAILGGIGPGLLATGLSAFTNADFSQSPLFPPQVPPDEAIARLIPVDPGADWLGCGGKGRRDAKNSYTN